LIACVSPRWKGGLRAFYNGRVMQGEALPGSEMCLQKSFPAR
jgi:hypothetical protein